MDSGNNRLLPTPDPKYSVRRLRVSKVQRKVETPARADQHVRDLTLPAPGWNQIRRQTLPLPGCRAHDGDEAAVYRSALAIAVVLSAASTVEAETGLASYYGGRGHHGEMTCAHRTRPFGSIVTVSHAGHSVHWPHQRSWTVRSRGNLYFEYEVSPHRAILARRLREQ